MFHNYAPYILSWGVNIQLGYLVILPNKSQQKYIFYYL